MTTNDDLTALLLAGNTGKLPDLGFHQGVIVEWNPQTGENVIQVAGSPIEDVQMLNVTEALVLEVGHVVALLRFKNTYFILGRIVTPNTDEFFSGVMPNLAYAAQEVNTDAATQNTTADSQYYPKYVAAFVVSHRRSFFRGLFQISTVGVVGQWRLQWYANHPGNGANPANGTLMFTSPSLAVSAEGGDVYTWPVAQRGELVYVSFEVRMTTGTTGIDWVAVLPRYLYGAD